VLSSIVEEKRIEKGPIVVVAPAEVDSKWVTATVDAVTERFKGLLQEKLQAGVPVGPGEFLNWESSLHADFSRECLDPVTAAVINAAHDEPVVVGRASAAVDATSNLHGQRASETVSVALLGGSEVKIQTPYFLKRERKRKRGGQRQKKGREQEGNGMYPVLGVLGIHNRTSPALASEIARLMAMSTEADVVQTLALRGLKFGRKRVVRIARRFAKRGLKYRQARMKRTEHGFRGSGQVRGKRLVIGTDGGRLRTRQNKKSGRRRRNGHRGFEAEWKEPKVLVVYEIDEKGRKRKGGVVYYDASMVKADGIFAILTSLLQEIGAHEADSWSIVGDGAAWIWNRIEELIRALGYDPAKVTEVVDFYHATEKLYLIASLVTGWKEAQRQAWAKTMRRQLKRGNVQKVIEEGHTLAHGPNKKQIRDTLNYFVTHRLRMQYDVYRKNHIPLGSGAVESCVRRTINLRFKSNGIFWLEESVEGLLHLRAQLLSGHWTDFTAAILQPEAFWCSDPAPNARFVLP
jgi:hypothetical protein